jgi:hypothetical protein
MPFSGPFQPFLTALKTTLFLTSLQNPQKRLISNKKRGSEPTVFTPPLFEQIPYFHAKADREHVILGIWEQIVL